MNYVEALDYLDTLYGLGSVLGLSRVNELMELLGNPQEDLKVIHVAGTNGKGSSCAMLSNVLISEGYNVGVYTSPHLEEYNERYTINNQRISNEDFGYYMGLVKTQCDKLKATEIGQPTIFEVVTALGFIYFADKKVDYLLLEVGLGGRYDATNVVSHPILSLITSISKDHMDFLGDTIEKIAYEKGGVIKKDCPTVLYSQGKKVHSVIKEIAKEKNSKLYFVEDNGIEVLTKTVEETVFNIENKYVSYKNIKMKLIGDYQLKNAATVILACQALKENGVEISEESIFKGFENAFWSGRMEIVSQNPTVILDGAHNVDGITMLAESLKYYYENKKITLLVGILGDKEYEQMIDTLLPLANKIILTEPNNSRKWDIDTLKDTIAKFNVESFFEKDIEKAFVLAKSETATDNVLCCAGSLYLIGELYRIARR